MRGAAGAVVALGARWPLAQDLGLTFVSDHARGEVRVESRTYGGDTVGRLSLLEAKGLMWHGPRAFEAWLRSAIDAYMDPVLVMRRAQVGG